MTARIEASDLRRRLLEDEELALVDVREELLFSESHLLHAGSAPLSRLELRIAPLVPRRSVRLIVTDAGDGLAQKAAIVLQRLGYDNVAVLDGGIAAWRSAGFELFSGVHVPSKAFGECVEHAYGTPGIDPLELHDLQARDADLVVLDSRPFDEYHRMSIPRSINVPGAELVLRVRDLVASDKTIIVVNCAGRTRSIIGAQSLRNAGVANPVMALRNGTMGWSLAGLACESGQARRAPEPTPAAISWAKGACSRVAVRHGVRRIGIGALHAFQEERDDRTLYVFDVRDPAEFARGHVPGAASAPGGQLVQATDQFVGTRGARIVLVDDQEVRAVMTASWLLQMGWRDVYVLAESGSETGTPSRPLAGSAWPDAAVSPSGLKAMLEADAVNLLDLSLSRNYRNEHIPGATFAIRSRLQRALGVLSGDDRPVVLTSEDGVVAGLAMPELKALRDGTGSCLAGGNAAWSAAGYPLESGEGRAADDPVDVWLKPYERSGPHAGAMVEYLTWEVGLMEKIETDGTCRFRLPMPDSDPRPDPKNQCGAGGAAA